MSHILGSYRQKTQNESLCKLCVMVIHLGFVSALSKEIIHLPISISPGFFMTHYFVSSYCCCILVLLWYTFSIHLFSCVIPSCHMTMIFNFQSPTMYVLSIYFLQVWLAHEYRLPTASCFILSTLKHFFALWATFEQHFTFRANFEQHMSSKTI